MDPIAEMLTSIINASRVKKVAAVPKSKLKIKILEILKSEKIIQDFEIAKNNPNILVVKPTENIESIKKISTPGRRFYIKAKQIRIKPGTVQIVSTPLGVLTSADARKKHAGGELLFEVRI